MKPIDRPFCLLTADTAVADHIFRIPLDIKLMRDGKVRIEADPKLADLLNRYEIDPFTNSKVVFPDKAVFDDFFSQLAPYPFSIRPGGSSLNTVATMAQVMGDKASVTFLSAVGDECHGEPIHALFKECGIELFPRRNSMSGHKTAASCALVFNGGERIFIIYPGSARNHVRQEALAAATQKRHDAFLLHGSAWEKFKPGFAEEILAARRAGRSELYLTLPTSKNFTSQTAAFFRYIIESQLPEVTLSNGPELTRVYETGDLKTALLRLQEIFFVAGKKYTRPPSAFVTAAEQGAYVVTEKRISRVPPMRLGAVVSKIGAGDTANAGFLLGHILGTDPRKSAEIGMLLAAAKMQSFDTYPQHPRRLFEQALRTDAADQTQHLFW